MKRLPTTLLLLCLVLPACAENKEGDNVLTEVRVSANHFMYGFGGNQGFTEFPVPPAKIGTDRGTLQLTDSGSYTIERNSQRSSPVSYQVATDSTLALLVPIANRAPTRFIGAYEQVGDGDLTQVYFFTDRFAPTSAPVVGFYWGTRTTSAHDITKARGEWHAFSQHVIFTSNKTFDPHNVGRSMAGSIEIKAPTSTGDDVVTGTGKDSKNVSLTFGGRARALGVNGELTLVVDYGSDERTFMASQAKEIILGVDEDESDGESGLIALVKKFAIDGATALKDAQTKLAGDWHIGMHTIFVAPTRSGIDAALGTIQFTDKGAFKLTAVGSQGPTNGTFTVTGAYRFNSIGADKWDNLLVLDVDGTKETWFAAVDSAYGALVFVDATVEARSGDASPELNLGMAIKKPEPKK